MKIKKRLKRRMAIVFIVTCCLATILALLPESTQKKIESFMETTKPLLNTIAIYCFKIAIAVFGGIIICLIADSAIDYLINIFSAEPKKKSKIVLLLKPTLSLGIFGIVTYWLITLSWVNAAAQFAVNLLFW